MDNKKIGEYISTLRKNKNMTQKELADLLSITDKAVSKWERGMGYPDISLLRPLATALGTSVNELLEGEASTEEVTDSSSNQIDNALNYAKRFYAFKSYNYGKILASIIMISCLLAISISIIVNVAVNHKISWSLLVTVSCLMGGSLIIPPLVRKKQGFRLSLYLLTIFIIPFLASLELILSGSVTSSGWLWNIGIPVSLTWLLTLWINVILYKKVKTSIWNLIGITLVLCIPGQIYTNFIVDQFTKDVDLSTRLNSTISSIICIIAISGICFIIGFNRKKTYTI